jgi:hypothetical protein
MNPFFGVNFQIAFKKKNIMELTPKRNVLLNESFHTPGRIWFTGVPKYNISDHHSDYFHLVQSHLSYPVKHPHWFLLLFLSSIMVKNSSFGTVYILTRFSQIILDISLGCSINMMKRLYIVAIIIIGMNQSIFTPNIIFVCSSAMIAIFDTVVGRYFFCLEWSIFILESHSFHFLNPFDRYHRMNVAHIKIGTLLLLVLCVYRLRLLHSSGHDVGSFVCFVPIVKTMKPKPTRGGVQS